MRNFIPLRISLPFVAGVALASWAPFGREALFASAWSLSTAIVILIGAFVFSERDYLLAETLLLFLGMFCSVSSRLAFLPAGQHISPTLTWLRNLIETTPFERDESAPLLEALLTGNKAALSRETRAAFQKAGGAHILAMSGLHLGVLSSLLGKILSPLGKSRPAYAARALCVAGASTAYTLVCGASPSLVRALLFICIREAQTLFPGRKGSGASTLCIAATIQLGLRPWVIESLAFQLSYLSMVGIAFIYPRMELWYPSSRGLFARIWKAAALGICCQITTAPLVWLKFHTFPAMFLLTNLIALPIAELTMVCGALLTTARASGFGPEALVWVCDHLCSALVRTVETIASI